MRFDTDGEVAKNHEGRSIATWYVRPEDGKTYHLFQQPVTPGDTEGPHEMTLRLKGAPVGRGTLRFGLPGANYWASRGSSWVRQEEASNPKTIGSALWIPGDARVGSGTSMNGDVDFNGDIFVMDRATMLTMWVNGDPFTRTGVDGGTRLYQGLLAWTEGGRVQVHDTRNDRPVTVTQVAPGASGALAFRDGQDRVWVLYQTDAEFGLVHLASDASKGYRFGVVKDNDNGIFDPEVFLSGEGCVVGWNRDKLQKFDQFIDIIELGQGMESLKATAPVPIPVPDVIAPNVTKMFKGAWRVFPDTPGNLSIGPVTSKVVICWPEELAAFGQHSNVFGLMVDEQFGPLKDRIAACRVIAEQMKLVLCVYVDAPNFDYAQVKQWCGSTPWIPVLQCYLDPNASVVNETLDAFDARIRAQVATFDRPWMAAVRCTVPAGSALTKARVIGAMNRLVPIVQRNTCLGWGLFAWNRGDGAVSDPDLLNAATIWLGGGTSVAPQDARLTAASYYPVVTPPAPPVEHPVPPVPLPTAPVAVTAAQVATILRGAFFDRVCVHLGLPIGDGTQAAARPKVDAWMLARIEFIEAAYRRVFKRGCIGVPGDYEAFGSRMELYLARKLGDAAVEAVLQSEYDKGAR